MKVEVDASELKRVFILMEHIHDVFHQESKYKDPEKIVEFVNTYYPEIRDVYYDVLWDMLPQSMQKQLEDRPET
jgi:hypothetical protein